MKRVLVSIVVAVLWLTAGTTSGVRAEPLTDPDAIFRAARKAWPFINYSRYATYTIVATFRNGRAKVQRHYDTIEDTRRGIVFARTFSREEIADPSIPHGINVRVGSLNNHGGVLANDEQNDDRIGPLALGVNYDFGISLLPQRTTVVSAGKDIKFPPNLPIIGTTATNTRDYTVQLIEMLDGGKTYHLGLVPVRDPSRFRLREMWVTAGSFVTQRILIAGNFNDEPYTKVPWLIEFNQVGGASYISREIAEAPLDFEDKITLPNVVITFEDLKPMSVLPQYGAVGENDSSKVITEP